MCPIDQRKLLDENPFDYQVFKNNKVQIFYKNKAIMLLRPENGLKLIKTIENASDHDIQLALAKITGNFKHGNEKTMKKENYVK